MSDSWVQKTPLETACPTTAQVREYLHALLGRRELNLSERNRRFLTYVVEETLAGRGDRIKAYNVALTAFGRGEDFNPLVDPIVRIEAGRLRSGLEHYYLTAGKADPIRIDIPKGAYVATFDFVADASCDAADSEPGQATQVVNSPGATQTLPPVRRWDWSRISPICALVLVGAFLVVSLWSSRSASTGEPGIANPRSIVIVPFESGDAQASLFVRGLTYELVSALSQSDRLSVFEGAVASNGSNHPLDAIDQDFSYALSGSAQVQEANARIIVILSEYRSGRILRSWSFEDEVGPDLSWRLQRRIATQISMGLTSLTEANRANGGAGAPYACQLASRRESFNVYYSSRS